MKTTLVAVIMAAFSVTAYGQVYNQVRVASDIEGGIGYLGLRRTVEVIGDPSSAISVSIGAEVGSILKKANLGPSVDMRLAPNAPVSLYGSYQQNLLLGETNVEYGLEAKVSNSARVSLGKIENERGSTTYVGVRVKAGRI